MKTIEERAKESVIAPFDPDEMIPARLGYLSMLERRGFVAGAMSERNELLCWHDPKVVTPYIDEEVLVRVHRQFNTYDVMRYDQYGWWQKAPGGGWCAADCEIVGWRPIHKIEQMP